MSNDLSIFSIILLAVVLGIDAFSMAIGVGMQGVSISQTSQLSLFIGSLHIVLPLLGIYLGQILGTVTGDIASSIGAIVLIVLGSKMIYEEFTGDQENMQLSSGWQFIILPVSVSLDSLSIGFSLGTFGIEKLFFVTGIFGLVAGIMTAGGVFLGSRLGHVVKKTGILGGSILLILGLKMLFF